MGGLWLSLEVVDIFVIYILLVRFWLYGFNLIVKKVGECSFFMYVGRGSRIGEYLVSF